MSYVPKKKCRYCANEFSGMNVECPECGSRDLIETDLHKGAQDSQETKNYFALGLIGTFIVAGAAYYVTGKVVISFIVVTAFVVYQLKK